MKYKLILLFFLGFIGLSAAVKNQVSNTVLNNMVMVPRSTFFMGIDSVQLEYDINTFKAPPSFFSQEYPAFRVTVIPFYIDKYEVTNAEFKKFIDANPKWSKSNIPDSLQDGNYLEDWTGNKYPKLKGNYPVVNICFYAANAYAHWKGKRLPSEAEWECAAKGLDKSSVFPWGNADADTTKANYFQSETRHAVQVGHYAPNSLGLYDMAGNVYEFCIDRWRLNMYAAMAKFKHGFNRNIFPTADMKRVAIRGGSWNSPAVNLRTTYRESCLVNSCSAYVGFRCAASIPANQEIK
jgi:formylglycine-generating enzyme required for sulfatase activity